MCSRSIVRERERERERERVCTYLSSMADTHICKVVQPPENTHEELRGMLEWPAGLSLRLWDQPTSPLSLNDQRISAFCPKLQTSYSFFESLVDIWISSSPTYFSVYGWLSDLTYFRFFPVILWILSAYGNICHSTHI